VYVNTEILDILVYLTRSFPEESPNLVNLSLRDIHVTSIISLKTRLPIVVEIVNIWRDKAIRHPLVKPAGRNVPGMWVIGY